MGFRTLLQNQVDLAFRMAGDLAYDVVFSSASVGSYDFAIDDATVTPVTSKVIKAVMYEEKSAEDPQKSHLTKKLLVKAADIGSPDVYDTVTIDGGVWRMIPPYKSNDFTVEIAIQRET